MSQMALPFQEPPEPGFQVVLRFPPAGLHQLLGIGYQMPISVTHPARHLADIQRLAGDLRDRLGDVFDSGPGPSAHVIDVEAGTASRRRRYQRSGGIQHEDEVPPGPEIPKLDRLAFAEGSHDVWQDMGVSLPWPVGV